MSAQALGDPQPELRGPAYEWALWSTTVRVVTSDPAALRSAKRLVDDVLAHVELATSTTRSDSEVSRLATGRWVRISRTLVAVLGAALEAARETDGAMDPTSGGLSPVGFRPAVTNADVAEVTRSVVSCTVPTARPDRWRGIELDEERRMVRLPAGVRLDLRPIPRAWAADRCAQVVAEQLEVGCLVSLGGDIATAGPIGATADGGWEILVHNREDDPGSVVALPTGLCIATASTAAARWREDGNELRHLPNPLTGPGVCMDWHAATVIATDCVSASTWATACLISDLGVPERLDAAGLPVRLVGQGGRVRCLGGWPEDAELDEMTSLSWSHPGRGRMSVPYSNNCGFNQSPPEP